MNDTSDNALRSSNPVTDLFLAELIARYDAAPGAHWCGRAVVDCLRELQQRRSSETNEPPVKRPKLTNRQPWARKVSVVSEWQPIETAPQQKDLELLVFCSDTREQFVAYQRLMDGRWTYARGRFGEVICRPTHWMSLPEPPHLQHSDGGSHG